MTNSQYFENIIEGEIFVGSKSSTLPSRVTRIAKLRMNSKKKLNTKLRTKNKTMTRQILIKNLSIWKIWDPSCKKPNRTKARLPNQTKMASSKKWLLLWCENRSQSKVTKFVFVTIILVTNYPHVTTKPKTLIYVLM